MSNLSTRLLALQPFRNARRMKDDSLPPPPLKKRPWPALFLAFAATLFILLISPALITMIAPASPTSVAGLSTPLLASALAESSSPLEWVTMRSDPVSDDRLKGYDDNVFVLGSQYPRISIGSIRFIDRSSDKPSDAWDVSADGDGSVWAWVFASDQMTRMGSALYDLTIAGEGRIKLNENAHSLFAKYSNLKRIDFNGCVDTSDVTDMSHMFYGCAELTDLDVSSFHTENVTDMRSMFSGCYCLTDLDLSAFRTTHVMNMGRMFFDCSDLAQLDVSSFDTANVTDMQFMFYACESLTALDLSSFDTANVTSMLCMFNHCVSLPSLDLSSFDTARVTDLSCMFYWCKNLSSISASNRFIINENAETRDMFQGCPSDAVSVPKGEDWGVMRDDDIVLDSDYRSSAKALGSEYERSQIRSIRFTGTLEGKPADAWDVSAGQNGSVWAWVTPAGASSEDGLALYDLVIAADGNVKLNKTARRLFAQYVNLERIDFGDCVDTSGVQYMAEMFSYCSALKALDLSCFDTSHVSMMFEMFSNCTALETIDLSSFNTAMLTNLAGMFFECESLTHLDLHHFDTSNVTNMGGLFMYCHSLTDVDLSSFQTHNVTSMSDMFYECGRLSSLDLSHFDTSNVTNMYEMFCNCSKLIHLNLSSFDTSNVTDMAWMFQSCESLETLDLTSFDTSGAERVSGMFDYCFCLKELTISERFLLYEGYSPDDDLFFDCPIQSFSDCIIVKADAGSSFGSTVLPSPSPIPSIDQGALAFLSASDSDALFEQYEITDGPFPEFQISQNFALYTGPGYEYAPVYEDGQELLIRSSRRITTFGVENGWHLMEYAVEGSKHRFGYINEEDFLKTPKIFSAVLPDAQWPAVIAGETDVTDDPNYSKETIYSLPDGALVKFIHSFVDNRGQVWACVEAENTDGLLLRGFIPKDSVRLLSDPSFPVVMQAPVSVFGLDVLGKRETVNLIEQYKLASGTGPRIDTSQNLPIYTGPGHEYAPVYQDNDAAYVKSTRQISAFGSQDGWQLIEYPISGNRHRYCYIDEEQITGYSWFQSNALPNAQLPAVLLTDTGVTDDPSYSNAPLYNLRAGTHVQFVFSQKDRKFKYWLCIESENDEGQLFRGFVPMSALALIRE